MRCNSSLLSSSVSETNFRAIRSHLDQTVTVTDEMIGTAGFEPEMNIEKTNDAISFRHNDIICDAFRNGCLVYSSGT